MVCVCCPWHGCPIVWKVECPEDEEFKANLGNVRLYLKTIGRGKEEERDCTIVSYGVYFIFP